MVENPDNTGDSVLSSCFGRKIVTEKSGVVLQLRHPG